jgi:uncharacterized protein YjbJ (UPF0337 family)
MSGCELFVCSTNTGAADSFPLKRKKKILSKTPATRNPPALPAVSAAGKRLHQERSSHMNWDQIEGNWKQFKGEAQKQWGHLTNDDLDVVDGERTKLVGRIQERYGCAREEAERQVQDWERTL